MVAFLEAFNAAGSLLVVFACPFIVLSVACDFFDVWDEFKRRGDE
jgi:hypothetical protein